MRFDFWTFSFQVINFIVLLFILKGLLYKPVREMIEKRRELSRKMVEDAETMKKEALSMKEAQEREMKTIQDTKEELVERAREEAEGERKRLMLDAQKGAQALIEKERALFETEKRRAGEELNDAAARLVETFAVSLLKSISPEEVHKSIWRNLYKEAGQIAKGIPAAQGPSGSSSAQVELAVRTAWPIGESELEKFIGTLQPLVPGVRLLAMEVPDKDLIAGVSIKAGDKVYDFSLAGQIEAFAGKLKAGRKISDEK